MARPAYGEEQFFRDILTLAGDRNRVENPVPLLSEMTKMSEVTVKKYLKFLVAGNYIEIVRGGWNGQQVKYITILNRQFIAPQILMRVAAESRREIVEVEPKPESVRPAEPIKKPEPMAPHVPIEDENKLAAILIDYDNICGRAQEAGFTISFERLKSFLRRYGRILFADLYTSPRSRNPEMIKRASAAGFRVISCPMAFKDKDSVDSKMKIDGQKYLELAGIESIVIISCDRDFLDIVSLAKDLHKSGRMLDVMAYREEIEGEDHLGPERYSRNVQLYIEAINALTGDASADNPELTSKMNLIREMILKFSEFSNHQGSARHLTFRALQDYLWSRLSSRWDRIINPDHDLKNAMTALIKESVITQHHGNSITYYTLNQNHLAVRVALSATRAG